MVNSFNHFNDFNGFKLSAALSYYTVFSVAPLLIVIISLAGIFFGRLAVEGRVYHQISGLVGSETALQIQDIIRNTQESSHGKLGGLIGSIILIIGASGVFSEIQSSINYLWGIPAPKEKAFLIAIFRKLISFSLLIAVAFLLLVSLTANALIDILSDRLKGFFSDSTVKSVLFRKPWTDRTCYQLDVYADFQNTSQFIYILEKCLRRGSGYFSAFSWSVNFSSGYISDIQKSAPHTALPHRS